MVMIVVGGSNYCNTAAGPLGIRQPADGKRAAAVIKTFAGTERAGHNREGREGSRKSKQP